MTWADRIVDRWLYDSLSKQLHDWFLPGCFAYRLSARGEYGVDACQNAVAKDLQTYKYFIKRDISSFFYSIRHDILLKQLSELVDDQDPLFKMLVDRISCSWIDQEGETGVNDIGVPFGCASACLLANLHLRPIDEQICALPVRYYRYADDFLMLGNDPNKLLEAANLLDEGIKERGLSCKPSHSHNYAFVEQPGFEFIKRFKYLGLEFCSDGQVRLAIEKQRKIRRIYWLTLDAQKRQLRNLPFTEQVKKAVEVVNDVLLERVRSISIIDYYLSHISDEKQLVILDRLIIEDLISTVLNKRFKKGHFKHISPSWLRSLGLISLLHRHRLIKHGVIKTSFFDLRNSKIVERHVRKMELRREKINYIRITRKRKCDQTPR